MSDDRPARYIEGDTVVYRASALGSCERRLVAHARKYPAKPNPQWFQEVLDEGTAYEETIRQEWLMLDDREPGDTQAEIELELFTNAAGQTVIVRAHADELVGNAKDGWVLREYKKFRDSTWPNFVRMGVEVHDNYPWQVAAMMHGLLQRGGDVVCEFVGGHLIDDQIIEVGGPGLIFDPPIPLNAIIKKIARVERLLDEGFDPAEVPCNVTFPCPFWYIHDPKEEVEEVALDPEVHGAEVVEAWNHWWTANQGAKDAKAVLDKEEKRKKDAAAVLQAAIGGAMKVTYADRTLNRVIRTVEEATIVRKGYTSDYFTPPRQSKKEQEDG